MIFNDEVLYVHVPKTGGMSVTHLLLEVLARPLFYTLPDPDSDPAERAEKIEGKRHESLREAAEVLAPFGRKLDDFAMILAVLRNPYDLEVSRYAYLQKGHAWDAGHNQDLAMHQDFETFTKMSVDHAQTPLQSYFLLDGAKPENLRILRQEHLDEELAAVLSEIGVTTTATLERRNASHRDDYRRYYTAEAEAAVHHRYRWVFESGFYPRLDLDGLVGAETGGKGHLLPLVGPVRQVGPSSGFHRDGWVGPELRFSVRATAPTRHLTLEGSAPPSFRGAGVRLDSGQGTPVAEVQDAMSFSVKFPLDLAPDQPANLVVTPSRTWSLADSGGQDRRRLSFHLDAVRFA